MRFLTLPLFFQIMKIWPTSLIWGQLQWFSSKSYTALQEGSNAALSLFQGTTEWTNPPCLSRLKNSLNHDPLKMTEASCKWLTESLGLNKNIVCYCRWKLRVKLNQWCWFDTDLEGMSCLSMVLHPVLSLSFIRSTMILSMRFRIWWTSHRLTVALTHRLVWTKSNLF